MKRFLLRFTALASVVAVGFIAIAQAQRAVRENAAEPAIQSGPADDFDDAPGAINAGEPSSADSAPTSVDPFERDAPRYIVGDDDDGAEEYRPTEPTDSALPADHATEPIQPWPEDEPAMDGGQVETSGGYAAHNDIPHAEEVLGPNGAPVAQARYVESIETNEYAAASAPSAEVPYAQQETERYPQSARRQQAPATLDQPMTDALPLDSAADDEEPYGAVGDQVEQHYAPAAMPRQFEEPQQPATDAFDRPRSPAATPAGEAGNFGSGTAGVDSSYVEGTGKPGSPELEGPQSPSLAIEKVAPEELQVGQPAIFEIRVRNVGTTTAQGIEIHDIVPRGTQLISTNPRASRGASGELVWALGPLPPGEEAVVEVELMPTTEGEIGSVATVHFRAEASINRRATRPQLAIQVDAPSQVMIGEEMTLSINVSNPGSGRATGVVLSKTLPPELTHPAGSELEYEVGTLAPNQSQTLELHVTAAKAGRLTETVVALGEGNLEARTDFDVEIIAPALEVAMEGPRRRFLEREATYTVSVSNPGTAPAHEVKLVTHLPPGLKFVSADNYGEYDAANRSVHWLLEELPPNETGSVTLKAVPVTPGEQKLVVSGTAEQGLSVEHEEEIVVEGVAAILFQVADVHDPIELNGETTYEIRVVNQGTKAATNVQVVALLPPEFHPVSAEGPSRHVIDQTRVLFDPLPKLAPKADTTYRVTVQAVKPGDVRLRVQLLTDEISSPVTKEESTRVFGDE